MEFDFYYGLQSQTFSFYRIPKLLFTNPRFSSLSAEAKTLYGILLDRMDLSMKNGWLDKQNRVYLFFTVQEIQESLGCGKNKAIQLMKELEKMGLIERKRPGRCFREANVFCCYMQAILFVFDNRGLKPTTALNLQRIFVNGRRRSGHGSVQRIVHRRAVD